MKRNELIVQMQHERSLLKDAKILVKQREEDLQNTANDLARLDAREAGFSVGMIICHKHGDFEALGMVEDIVFRGEHSGPFCFMSRTFDFRKRGGCFSGINFSHEQVSSIAICVPLEDLILDWSGHP